MAYWCIAKMLGKLNVKLLNLCLHLHNLRLTDYIVEND